MLKKQIKILFSLAQVYCLLIFSFFAKTSLAAWGGLVPCGNTNEQGVIVTPCDFNTFMALINKIINFALFDLALPLAAIMFAYAGFELVTSSGSKEKRGVAKSVFTNAIYGLVFAAAGWLVIKTLLSILGYDGAWIFDRFN